MGLFLLGLPLAVVGAKMMHNDIKHTHDDIMVSDAPRSLSDQKKEIDLNFKNILRYCGASCDIKNVYDSSYNYIDDRNNKILIDNIQCGSYGTMEQYLFSKGYSKEAIEYCKNKFDTLGGKQQETRNNARDERIQAYERAMNISQCQDIRLQNKVHYNFYHTEVEMDCKTLEKYFNSKGHNTQCNIIMGDRMPNVNHTEVWLLRQPKGYDVKQYYLDVCDKLNIRR